MSELYHALVALVIVDYLTGMLKAKVFNAYDSGIGFRGVAKHGTLLVLATLINYTNYLPFMSGELLLTFWIYNYVMSVFENIGVLGIPVPKQLKMKVEKDLKELQGEKNE